MATSSVPIMGTDEADTAAIPKPSFLRKAKALRAANKNPLPYNLSAHACAANVDGSAAGREWYQNRDWDWDWV